MKVKLLRILCSTVLLIAGVCALFMLCTGCSTGKQKPGNTLYIYNWTYYMPDDVIRDFEKKFGVKVVYDMYASNEEMFTKLKAGGTGYDIVFPSGDHVSIMIKEGMLDTIDKSNVPNFANIDSMVLSKIKYDPGCRYSVPYMMGAAGVIVNKKKVPSYEKSWKIFDRTDMKGRMTMLDDMREVLGAALKMQGCSVNSSDSSELKKAKAVVAQWSRNIVKFDAEAFGKSFAAGEFWIVQGYQENVFKEIDSTMAPDIDFFIPKEGSPAYIDNMVILKNARNKELAHRFINYIHDPEIYARIVDYLKYPSINTKARQYRKIKPTYDIPDLANAELKEDLGQAVDIYNNIWQEIRVGK